jgi:hypothetical protein
VEIMPSQLAATSAMVPILSRVQKKKSSCKIYLRMDYANTKNAAGGSQKASFNIPTLSNPGSMSDEK